MAKESGKPPKVGIAVSLVGYVPVSFVASLVSIVRSSLLNGIYIDVALDVQKPLDKSRNFCVKKFLESDLDYIFFMDSDMLFKSNTLIKLLKQQKDIISGVYCYKKPPYSAVLKMNSEEKEGRYTRIWEYPKDKLFKVDACGAGCLLVSREVFEKLEKPWFKWEGSTSEDIYFCRKAKKAGYDIWVDGRVECGHLSEFIPVVPSKFWGNIKHNKEMADKVVEDEPHVKFLDYDGTSEDPIE